MIWEETNNLSEAHAEAFSRSWSAAPLVQALLVSRQG